MNDLKAVSKIAVGNAMPTLGIVLDIPYSAALERRCNRAAADRMESKGEAYHQRVRDGFLRIAEEEPERYVIVDATPSPESVAAVIQNIVSERFLY
jgi:dTMP kinase